MNEDWYCGKRQKGKMMLCQTVISVFPDRAKMPTILKS